MSKNNKDKKPVEGEQKQQQPQNQPKKANPLGQVTYLLRVAWRFYTTIITEAILALILVGPFYLWFVATDVTEITLPVNFYVFWAIGTEMFLLQSFMFKGK